jgi:chemotaxis protein CheD
MPTPLTPPRPPPSQLVVGVGELHVAGERGTRIVTYGLGSCVALCAYDPASRIGAMLHFMLGRSLGDPDDEQRRPCLYGVSGVPELLRRMREAGSAPERLVLCAAGGAEVLNDAGRFAIGGRNVATLARLLDEHRLELAASDLGGHCARNLSLDLETGRVTVRSRGKENLLWPC